MPDILVVFIRSQTKEMNKLTRTSYQRKDVRNLRKSKPSFIHLSCKFIYQNQFKIYILCPPSSFVYCDSITKCKDTVFKHHLVMH